MAEPTYLIRRPEVERRAGISGRQLDHLEHQGAFPRRVALSERTIGWVEAEVAEWVSARVAARDDRAPRWRAGVGQPPPE